MDLDSTIVSISSAQGYAKKSLVRISGSGAKHGILKLGLKPEFGSIVSGYINIENNKLPVLVGAFPKHASYTGDDLVEIQFTGNPHLARRLVSLCIEVTNGREATAGEFTARAFFSGRISLAQAEGVSATISASNNAELSGAALLREGALSKLTEPITSALTHTLALVEAGIDFSDEEDVTAITDTKLTENLTEVKRLLVSITERSIPMSALRHFPKVVLRGKPNVGKSTLFNCLVGKQRVVVNQESGTTRDAVEEVVVFGSTNTLLVDVAGLDVRTDSLSVSARIAAQNAINSADLVLWCIEPGDTIPDANEKTIVVKTKGDLIRKSDDAICAITGFGIDRLQKQISIFLQNAFLPNKHAVAIFPRHIELLHSGLAFVEDALINAHTPELCAACIRDSLHALGKITGKISPDDVLEHVFASFCVGK